MKKENAILFFILFFNTIQVISNFRLFQDKVDKRKKDSLVKDHENIKKNIIESIPYKLSEKLESNVKTNSFSKNYEEKSSYLVFNIETVKTNDTKTPKIQPVSSVKKNLTTSNKEFSIKIPPKNKTDEELKNQSAKVRKEIPLPVFKDVLSVGIDSRVNKSEGVKKTDFNTLKDDEEKITDIKQMKKLKNIIDTRKDEDVRQRIEKKKPDLIQVNRTEKNQTIAKSELDKKLQNTTKIKRDSASQQVIKKDDQTDVHKKDEKKIVDKTDDKKDGDKIVVDKKGDKKDDKKDVGKKDVDKKDVGKKDVDKKDDKKDAGNKDVDKKDAGKKDVDKKDIVKQDVGKKDVDKKEIGKKDVVKKEIGKKDVDKKEIGKKDVDKKIGKIEVIKKEEDKRDDKKDTKKKDDKKDSKKDVAKQEVTQNDDKKKEIDRKVIDKSTDVKSDKKTHDNIKIKKPVTEKIDKTNLKETKTVKNKMMDKRPEKVKTSVKSKQMAQTFIDPLNYYYNFKNIKHERCRRDGEEFEASLKDGKIWAMKMYDASAKIPSNILKGNLNQLGDYDQCINLVIKTQHENKKDHKISGKYCLASIDIEAEEDYMRLPVNLAQGRAFLRSRNKDPGHFIPKFSTIRWGVCVPASCSADDVEQMLMKHIENHNQSFSDLKLNIVIDSDDCVTKSHFNILDIDYPTIAAIIIITTFMVTSIFATIRDYAFMKNENSSVLDKIFMSFSIKQTKNSFLNTANDEIPCIHGIRAVTTILLYVAHKLIPLGHSPYTNRVLLTEMSNNPLSIILRVSIIYTDTFLLLSGILTAYHMSKDLDVRGYIPWVNRVLSRIIRLLPTLVVILLYYSYIMDEMGSGPLWNTVITQNANLCKDSWWKNILFIQNLYPFEEMCATHTHQLALDMQLFLIAPALVWLLQKRTYLGLFVTLTLHVISLGLRYYTTMKYKLSVIIYHGISLNQLFRTANLLYASSIHRATPYIAGICLGVTLRQLRPDFKIPKILSIITWIVTGYLIYWIFYTPSHLSNRMYRYNVEEAALFSSFCSVAWAFVLSWVIFASHLNYEGYLNKYLSSTPMILISKLSYTIYLVQFIVFFYNVGTIRAPSEFNMNEILNIKEFSTIISLSIILFLVVDLPMQEIKKILMRPSSQEKIKSNES